ncbi:hypothetical protein BJX99DRAFT_269322 [Aspergillus californicus]
MRGITFRRLVVPVLASGLSVASQPSASSIAPAPNPTICGYIVNHPNTTLFPATQAYDCLRSVPFHAAVASRLIQYVNDTIQFQSTLAYLAHPPSQYQQPAVDLIAGLDQIQDDIDGGIFQNEYAFEVALQRLLNAAHDDHLMFNGGILSSFVFGAPFEIVSVSLDGIALPKVYLANELLVNETEPLSWQPSAIKDINGQDAVQFLTESAALNSVGKLERHAEWNMLMRSGALDIQGYFEVFYNAATFYPGDSITLTFENGTVVGPVPWEAVYISPGDTGPLQTGDVSTTSVESDVPTPTPSPTTTWYGAYPSQVDVEPPSADAGEGLLRGYFLNDSSVGVLSIPQFYINADVADDFDTTGGMQKVIIDLQQNMGGQALLAIETFLQASPLLRSSYYVLIRRRVHDMANAIGDTLSPFFEGLPDDSDLYYEWVTNEWAVVHRLDANTGRRFTSWDDMQGPAESYDSDLFTKTERYSLSDPDFTYEAAGIKIERPDNATQPYRAEDIIILSDGLCSSACALFMELMRHEAGVRTVVVGGQPSHGPMQAPSGTRGAASYNTRQMDEDILWAQIINNKTLESLPLRMSDFFISAASVNLRDQVRRDDPSATPLQFSYEAADCRIFYTPKTWYNYTNLWNYAADAIWRNPALCVATSTHPRNPVPSTSSPVYTTNDDNIPHEATHQNDPSNDIWAVSSPNRDRLGFPCEDSRDCKSGNLVCKTVDTCHMGVKVDFVCLWSKPAGYNTTGFCEALESCFAILECMSYCIT